MVYTLAEKSLTLGYTPRFFEIAPKKFATLKGDKK
jgi:hypothetical protein